MWNHYFLSLFFVNQIQNLSSCLSYYQEHSLIGLSGFSYKSLKEVKINMVSNVTQGHEVSKEEDCPLVRRKSRGLLHSWMLSRDVVLTVLYKDYLVNWVISLDYL